MSQPAYKGMVVELLQSIGGSDIKPLTPTNIFSTTQARPMA